MLSFYQSWCYLSKTSISTHSPVQVSPSSKMYLQHKSHQVSPPPGSKVCPSPDSTFTLGSLSSGEKMVLTSGGLNPFFLPRAGPPPWPSIPVLAASTSPFLLSGFGELSGTSLPLQAASRLSRLAGWGDAFLRTALTTIPPLEFRIFAPGGGHDGAPVDPWMWTGCTGTGESSVTEERVGTYFRPPCTTLNITHTGHRWRRRVQWHGQVRPRRAPTESLHLCRPRLLSVSRLRQSGVCRGTGWISFHRSASNTTASEKECSVQNYVHKSAHLKFLVLTRSIVSLELNLNILMTFKGLYWVIQHHLTAAHVMITFSYFWCPAASSFTQLPVPLIKIQWSAAFVAYLQCWRLTTNR